jgi:hypothetical protein
MQEIEHPPNQIYPRTKKPKIKIKINESESGFESCECKRNDSKRPLCLVVQKPRRRCQYAQGMETPSKCSEQKQKQNGNQKNQKTNAKLGIEAS